MIREFEAAEFIAALLKTESNDRIVYKKSALMSQVRKIEHAHPDIRIDLGELSLARVGQQCSNVMITTKEVIVTNRKSLATRCLIAYNIPSKEVQKIFIEK